MTAGDVDCSALATQVGGDHYKNFAIQPVEFALVNGLNAAQANIVKYLVRDKSPDDIAKAAHYCELWLEMWRAGRLDVFGACLMRREREDVPIISVAGFVYANKINDPIVAAILVAVCVEPNETAIQHACVLLRVLARRLYAGGVPNER